MLKNIFIAILCLFMISSPMVLAKGKGKGKGGPPPHAKNKAVHKNKPGKSQKRHSSDNFSARKLNTIRSLLGTSVSPAKSLPPGMRNRLAKGKPLPPGIVIRNLSSDVVRRLPQIPDHS